MRRLAIKAAIGPMAMAIAQPAAAQQAPSQPAQTPATAGPAAPQQPPAQPSAVQAPNPSPPPVLERGPWSFTGVLTADLVSNAGGQRGGAEALGRVALSAAWDGSRVGRDGLNGLISIQGATGGDPSRSLVGDVQGVDSLEAPNYVRLYEAWLARDYDGHSGWKAGFVDLNVDFDVQEVGALFINSSNGVGPELSHSGLNGPSIFPVTALGMTGYWRPHEGLTIRGGIFDGTAGNPNRPKAFVAVRLSGRDGLFGIVQAERRYASGLRLEAGAWAYTAALDSPVRFDGDGKPLRVQRDRGAYATVEAPLQTDADDPERGLAGWVRVGLADPVAQRVTGYMGGGLVYSGPFKRRPQDQAGFSISHAIVDAPVAGGDRPYKSSETSYELTYRANVTDWLAVQPDVQWVVRPNGDPAIGNALVLGIRFTVTATRSLLRAVRAVAR